VKQNGHRVFLVIPAKAGIHLATNTMRRHGSRLSPE
jgi:hypothetical protein